MTAAASVVGNPWPGADPRAGTYPPGDPSAWYRLAWSGEVVPGALRVVSALGERFVLFRDGAGAVVVLNAYCPHLGADLGAGRLVGGKVECPFHRWQFGSDGHLCHVPAGGKVPRAIRARRWEAAEVAGMVFVWRGHGAPSPDVPTWADPFGGDLDGFRPVGRREESVGMHLIELVENSVDNQHFQPLHGQLCVPWTAVRVPGMGIRHVTEWHKDPERDWVVEFTDDAILTFRGRVLPRSGAFARISFIGPGAVMRMMFTIPDLGRVAMIQTQTPESAMRQRVGFAWYAERAVPSPIASYVAGNWYSQWLVDVAIWERKVYVERPQLVAADGPVQELRRWYRRFYEPGGGARSAASVSSNA